MGYIQIPTSEEEASACPGEDDRDGKSRTDQGADPLKHITPLIKILWYSQIQSDSVSSSQSLSLSYFNPGVAQPEWINGSRDSAM